MVCAAAQLEQSLEQMPVTQITSTGLQLCSQPYSNFHGERIFSSLKINRSRFVYRVDEREQNPGLVLGACQVTKGTRGVDSMVQLGTNSRGKSVSGRQKVKKTVIIGSNVQYAPP